MTTLSNSLGLSAESLHPALGQFGIPGSSADVAPLSEMVGQREARDAIAFGLEMAIDGYNIAVSGVAGSGRGTLVEQLVGRSAREKPAVADWIYVHNFGDERRPLAISLPAGLGDDLQRALARVSEACRVDLPRAFESDSYQQRTQEALAQLTPERDAALDAVNDFARQRGFAINATPMGLVPYPLSADGEPVDPRSLASMSDDQRHELEQRGAEVQSQIVATLREMRRLDGEARKLVARIDREILEFVIGHILQDLRVQFADYGLGSYLDSIDSDLAANLEIYKRFTDTFLQQVPPQMLSQVTEEREALLKKYAVNLFVSHGDQPGSGAPVVVEKHPSYQALFGRLDFESRFGAVTADFTRIRAGAIHLANGGYLILRAEELLAEPVAWPKLKEALKTREIRVESLATGFVPASVVDLVPAAIPLSVKVILIGGPMIFHVLNAIDSDFAQLFKIRAEFEPDTSLDDDAVRSYVSFIRQTADARGLRRFTRSAIELVLEYGSRLAGRQDRLTTQLGVIADLCGEADIFAGHEGVDAVDAKHVQSAIDGRLQRAQLIPERVRRMIREGAIHIDTSGSVVGQVNGLAVYSVGGCSFGTPTRITCRTGLGRRGVVAIERETERSGAVHSKGILVLSGFLTGAFGRTRPLAFNASLTFEQTYDEVEGDSASSAELYAILASLAELPIRQDIAVTGSVDQFGNIQAVGAVTEKIEGFFDVCNASGLTGAQGVIIPAANRPNLTLRPDVVDAVQKGRFHVWAVSRIEEGLELLTGLPAGAVDDQRDDSVFGRVTRTLIEMHAATARSISPTMDAVVSNGRGGPSD